MHNCTEEFNMYLVLQCEMVNHKLKLELVKVN